ncbi:hypothetical protein T492DRAFT_1049919 [Pavlovales sp. CCMP2436]|nr:hypothetical protein T492DRAFT_1049919 [Pavlovales sp. CCMP2436]
MATLSLAALALCTPGLASLAPPRPVLARPHTGRTQPGSPQAIDPRQAIWLQQNGYVWDGKAWGRGDAAAARAGRAFLRSGKRLARLAASPETLLLSFSAGVVVAASRSLARAQLPPGVEESTGMAERLLADALDGGHALPAPAHVRFGPDSRFNLLGLTNTSHMMAIGLEGLAAVSATLLMHALLQHALVGAMSPDATCSDVFAHAEVLGRNGALGATAAAAAAAVFASLPAAIRALSNEAAYQGDGLAAELDAARRARTRATAIFSAQFERAILGLGASLACAAAFQISVLIHFYICVLRFAPDAEATRATVQLPPSAQAEANGDAK